jgi:hypothetical protein
VPTTIQVTTSLPTRIPKDFDRQPSDGGQPRDSPGGSSPKGNLLREPPFNPPIGPFGWPALDMHMFIPPWYQPLVVQPMS